MCILTSIVQKLDEIETRRMTTHQAHQIAARSRGRGATLPEAGQARPLRRRRRPTQEDVERWCGLPYDQDGESAAFGRECAAGLPDLDDAALLDDLHECLPVFENDHYIRLMGSDLNGVLQDRAEHRQIRCDHPTGQVYVAAMLAELDRRGLEWDEIWSAR